MNGKYGIAMGEPFGRTCNMADAFHHLSMQVVWQQLFRQNQRISSAGVCIDAAYALGMRAERNAVSHMEI